MPAPRSLGLERIHTELPRYSLTPKVPKLQCWHTPNQREMVATPLRGGATFCDHASAQKKREFPI